MDNNSSMTPFVDIMAILMACFMLIAALLAAKVSKEYLHQVDLLNKEKQGQGKTGALGETSLFLTVTREGLLILEGEGIKPDLRMNDSLALKAALKERRPSRLFLRVDGSVPTGKTQSLLLDCQELGIQPSLAAMDRKGD